MSREECEKLIIDKLYEIKNIVKQYDKDFDYLGMCITNDTISGNNDWWDEHPELDFFENIKEN